MSQLATFFFSTIGCDARHKGGMRRTVVVSEPNAGRRVDAFMRLTLPTVSRGTLMKWLRTGVIRVNKAKAKPDQRLKAGDAITMPVLEGVEQPGESPYAGLVEEGEVRTSDQPKSDGPKSDRPTSDQPKSVRPASSPPRLSSSRSLSIIYEDADLLIVDKPAMLAAHAGTGQADSLVARVELYLDAENAPVGHKPGLAQRLDRGVSGLVPIGKHAGALRVLAKAASEDKARKIYRAVVLGEVKEAHGEITLALRVTDERMGDRPRVHPDPNGLPAHTTFTRVEVLHGASVLDVEIHTGRTHQIRAHLRAIGHPLIGDPRYGDARRERALGISLGRPALHARHLELTHPVTAIAITTDAPLPNDLEKLIQALRRPSKGRPS